MGDLAACQDAAAMAHRTAMVIAKDNATGMPIEVQRVVFVEALRLDDAKENRESHDDVLEEYLSRPTGAAFLLSRCSTSDNVSFDELCELFNGASMIEMQDVVQTLFRYGGVDTAGNSTGPSPEATTTGNSQPSGQSQKDSRKLSKLVRKKRRRSRRTN